MRKKSKNVCIIRHRYFPEELCILREARALQSDGYDVHVICIANNGEKKFEELDGFKIYRLPIKHKRKNFYNDELIVPIAFIISLLIIHSTSSALFGYSLYAKVLTGMFFVAFSFAIINSILIDYKN